MKATALGDTVLFAFLNSVGGQYSEFKDETKSGIILSTVMDEQRKGRWAKALLIGPDAGDIKNGQYIFIAPLMWTPGFMFDGVKIWKTDIAKILAVSDEIPEYQL